MKKLQIAYFGTPEFAAEFLEKLLNDSEIPVEVKFIVTQPDRPVGRKKIITPSPVKKIGLKYGIPVHNQETKEEVTQLLKSVDLALLLFFGKIIPKKMIQAPKYGFWNIHFSALPKYRGGLPHAFALMNGDRTAGISLFQMDEALDHGPIIAQEEIPIEPKDRRPDLERKLTELGYEMFKRVITVVIASEAKQSKSKIAASVRLHVGPPRNNIVALKEQDHSQATYTKLLKRADGFIDLINFKSLIRNQPQDLFNKFRGLYPWPGVWTTVTLNGAERRLKITDMDLVEGKLVIKKVQLEGKQEVDFQTFSRAYGDLLL